MTARTDTHWPVTWSDVEDAQLRDWLRTTPVQQLAWLEEMLMFVRMAGTLQHVHQEKISRARFDPCVSVEGIRHGE